MPAPLPARLPARLLPAQHPNLAGGHTCSTGPSLGLAVCHSLEPSPHKPNTTNLTQCPRQVIHPAAAGHPRPHTARGVGGQRGGARGQALPGTPHRQHLHVPHLQGKPSAGGRRGCGVRVTSTGTKRASGGVRVPVRLLPVPIAQPSPIPRGLGLLNNAQSCVSTCPNPPCLPTRPRKPASWRRRWAARWRTAAWARTPAAPSLGPTRQSGCSRCRSVLFEQACLACVAVCAWWRTGGSKACSWGCAQAQRGCC